MYIYYICFVKTNRKFEQIIQNKEFFLLQKRQAVSWKCNIDNAVIRNATGEFSILVRVIYYIKFIKYVNVYCYVKNSQF